MEVQSSCVNSDASGATNRNGSPDPGDGIVDPLVGKACHQCRQKIRSSGVICKNQRKNKPCSIKLCKNCLLNRYGEQIEVVKASEKWSCPKCNGICNCSVCMKRRGHQPTGPLIGKVKDKRNSNVSEITLPVGKELTILAGIELPTKDIGNGLQFLEFFFTFGQLLAVRQGLPEQVLHDLFHGRSARRGIYSMTVQLHVHMLSELQTEDEEIAGAESPDYQRIPWFQKLKDCLSETQMMLKLPVLDSLEKATDYENLDASEKLMILNILCEELLGMEKVRNFIDNENTKFVEKLKEARRKRRDLMKKMKTVTEEAVIPNEGDYITISEQAESSDKSVAAQAEAFSDKSVAAQAETSSDKSVAAEDNANVVELDEMLLKGNPTCDAVRTDPVFVDPRGHAYWKLNCLGKHEILAEDIGNGDGTSTFNEKWSILDAEEKDVVENHVNSVKKHRKKRGLRKV